MSKASTSIGQTSMQIPHWGPPWLYRARWPRWPPTPRAFRARGGRPKSSQRAEIVLSEELAAALAGLSAEAFKESLGRLIAPIQIKTVLKRRNALLKPLQKH